MCTRVRFPGSQLNHHRALLPGGQFMGNLECVRREPENRPMLVVFWAILINHLVLNEISEYLGWQLQAR